MLQGWTPTRIGDICKTNTQTYSVSEKWSFVNYLDTGNITENRISEIQHLVAGQDTLPSRARRKVAVDDILYSTVRPNQRHYGIVKEVLPNMLVSTGFTVITPDKAKADADFLYYYLSQSNIVDGLHAIGEQSVSAYPSIKPSNIEGLEMLLPPLPEQVEIGRTLRALDDKITNNSKINHHLEQMAQIAFERFLIADSADEPIGILSDIAEINPLRTLFRGQEAVYVEMANLPTRSSFPTDWTMRPFSGGMKFTNGDTIMARITPCLENGKTAYINFLEEGAVAFGSTEYIVITSKPGYCKEMFYYLARSPDFVSYAVRNMNGSSGRQRVSSDTIGRYKLHIPNTESVREFAEIAAPITESIRQNALENRNLAALRDTLLPKLMSGELSVADLGDVK
jgi:type I restriction enzyme S subunit